MTAMIKERLMEDMKAAMKARDKETVSVLRMVLSEIKYAQAAENVHKEISEEEVSKVIMGYRKRLEKSLPDYPPGEKQDAIKSELKIIDRYLPQKVGEDQIRSSITELLASTTDRQFGPLMKQVMAKFGSSADGRLVSELLKKALENA